MKKTDLEERIISAIDGEEWEMLYNGTLNVPVSEFNRQVLLELMDEYNDFGDYSVEISERQVDELSEALKVFLEETWPEQPDAHKYVIYACLIRTFLDEKPMHPQEKTKYHTVIKDEKEQFFCPHKNSSTICGFCVARSCEPLYEEWDRQIAETKERFGTRSSDLQRFVYEAGFIEAGIIPTKDLIYYEELRNYCKENRCGHFGVSWACPPAVGTVEECRRKALEYDYMILFSKAYYLPFAYDLESMRPAVTDFKKSVSALDSTIRPRYPERLILSVDSCYRCEDCTYPDAPCRFPDELYYTIEGFGFYVIGLAKQARIRYNNGSDYVTLFGAVFYNDSI